MKDKKSRAPESKEIKLSMTGMRARRIRKKRIIILTVCISAISILSVIMIAVLFLKIGNVEIEGNIKYKSEDILKVSGIEKGDGIVALNKSEVTERIKKEFPAINKVEIRRILPAKVKITVTEMKEVMFVAFGQHYYSLDSNLCVVEKYNSIEDAEVMGLKRIYLPGVTECIAGQTIIMEDDRIHEMVKTLHDNLVNHDFYNEIVEIDFRDKFDITFNIGVKYVVKLGNILECSTKLEILDGIIVKVGMDYIGTIDLSSGDIKNVTLSRG